MPKFGIPSFISGFHTNWFNYRINFTRKIAVEVQGEQHNEFNKFFHNNSRDKYLESIQRDMKKIQWLEMNEFQVLELTKEDFPELSRKYIFDTFGVDI